MASRWAGRERGRERGCGEGPEVERSCLVSFRRLALSVEIILE
jgi:hypothetical protein